MDRVIKSKYILGTINGKLKVFSDSGIKIEEGIITEMGPNIDTKGYDVEVFKTHLLMPGLINTHTHTAMTLFRGYADDVPLDTWLNEHIWPLEAKLDAKEVEVGAKMAAIEAMLTGTTTMNSMYWFPEAEAKAFSEQGLRGMIGPPIISGVNTLETYKHLIPDWHGANGDMIRVTLNPHAPYTVTDEEYRSIHQFKEDYNTNNSKPPLHVHTHLAETKNEIDMIRGYLSQSGKNIDVQIKTSTKYLDSLGVLDEHFIAAHGVECSKGDMKILAKRGVGVALNPMSNLKLGNNIVNISQMQERGVKLGLGTDGPASNNSLDMFETMKLSSLLQKSVNNNPIKGLAEDTIKMATAGGAEVLGWDSIGSIEVGKRADVILLDLKKPHLMPIINPEALISNVVYAAKGSDVTDVMIDGNWRVRENTLLDINLEEMYEEFNRTVTGLFAKLKE
ncbi:MAG: amidohydrolase [Candidatus Heimdallarchaeota archaeon]|nr:amidohydrolase [Candidatus Heimdallarchaeota archaeon]